jgi:TRAP-type C4-dicarboxylate transport system substrate-binding protein
MRARHGPGYASSARGARPPPSPKEETMKNACPIAALAAAAALLAAPAAPRAEEPLTLKFVFPAPPSDFEKVMLDWNAEVEKASGGAVKVQMYIGTSVANFANVIDRIENGVVDIGFGIYGPYSRQVPKTFVVELPFESDTSTEGSLGLWRLNEKGVTSDEYKNYHLLALFCFTGTSLHSSRPVRVAGDLKGLKIAASGKLMADDLKLFGAAPVTINPTEFYESLNRGVVQGVLVSWEGSQTFKLPEVAHHHLTVPFGQFPAFVAMNKASYGRLPDKVKAAVDKYAGEPFSRALGAELDDTNKKAIAAYKAMKGQEVGQLSPAEAERWKHALAPVTAQWVKETPDGARVLDAFRAEVKRIRAGS